MPRGKGREIGWDEMGWGGCLQRCLRRLKWLDAVVAVLEGRLWWRGDGERKADVVLASYQPWD